MTSTLRLHAPACQGQCTDFPHCRCLWETSTTTPKLNVLASCLLASGSSYRAELLRRLCLPFLQISPDADESPGIGETPTELAIRLAKVKAQAPDIQDVCAKTSHPLIIIASDQVAAVGDQILGKPGTHERAQQQLLSMQGQSVSFHTSLFMRNTENGACFHALDTTIATLRPLNVAEIDRYIQRDEPLDCAGSFKVEALGISLFERIETSDPTALVGLPMMSVCKGLREFGVDVP